MPPAHWPRVRAARTSAHPARWSGGCLQGSRQRDSFIIGIDVSTTNKVDAMTLLNEDVYPEKSMIFMQETSGLDGNDKTKAMLLGLIYL